MSSRLADLSQRNRAMTVGFTEKESLVPGAIAICHKTGRMFHRRNYLVPGLVNSWYKIGGDWPWGRRSARSCTRFGLFLVQDKEVCDG
jgi:hypothetical protein